MCVGQVLLELEAKIKHTHKLVMAPEGLKPFPGDFEGRGSSLHPTLRIAAPEASATDGRSKLDEASLHSAAGK